MRFLRNFGAFWRVICITALALFASNTFAATECPSNASLNGSDCVCNTGYTKTSHNYTFNSNTKVTSANKTNYTLAANGYEYTVPLTGLVSGADVNITGQMILWNSNSGVTLSTPAGSNTGTRCWCRIVEPFETIWKNSSSSASDFNTCASTCVAKISSSSVSSFYGAVNTGILMGGEVCEATTPATYTITYDLQGGTGCTNETYSGTTTLCQPTRDGYTFGGWHDYDSNNIYYGGESITNTNLNLEAQWTPKTYTIRYVDEDGNVLTTSNLTNWVYGTTTSFNLQDPALPEDWLFNGWYTDNLIYEDNGFGNKITEITADIVTQYAQNGVLTIYGYRYPQPVFWMTTTQMSANEKFAFYMQFIGTLYVDWGDGTISKTNIANNRAFIAYHNYKNDGVYKIGLSSTNITEYPYSDEAVFSDTCSYSVYPTFSITNCFATSTFATVGLTPLKLAKIEGKLGDVFPTLPNGTNPNFAHAFCGCSNLTGSIPDGFFDKIHGQPVNAMFLGTFESTGLSGPIPNNLFGGLNGNYTDGLFALTFSRWNGVANPNPDLTQISFSGNLPSDITDPETGEKYSGLFGKLSGEPKKCMFAETFEDLNNLTGHIPEKLFGDINGTPAARMFNRTFDDCSNLTGSIPLGLFGNITGPIKNGSFRLTFSGASGLTGSIPENLFGNVTGTATQAFYETFKGATNLGKVGENGKSPIPANLFANISGDITGTEMFNGTFEGTQYLTDPVPTQLFHGVTGFLTDNDQGLKPSTYTPGGMTNIFNNSSVATSCPVNYYQYITGFEDDWDGRVACEQCPLSFPNSDINDNDNITRCYTDCPVDTNGGTYVSGHTYWNENGGDSSNCVYQYTITYNLNNGTGCSDTTYTDSTTLCEPTRDGYTFNGWATTNGGATVYNANDNISGTNLTLYANWTQISYTITYNLNGGTGCSDTTYTGSTTLCEPTRDGYTFNGWATTDGGATEYNANDSVSGTSLTLYANWENTYPFAITTTNMTGTNQVFKWSISASGTFYVDCGDNGVLSGTGVSGNTITRSDTTAAQYTCTYPTAGTHTIRIGGAANGYNTTNSSSGLYAAIGFSTQNYRNNTPAKIAGISGSLGEIFGTIGNGDTLATQPRFISTFSGATNMSGSIPSNLFTGIHGAPAQSMFFNTFYNCSGLTGTIPSTLFCQDTNNPNANNCIYGAPASRMFDTTFGGCSKLSGQIPATLFAGIHGAPASNMFYGTFWGCSGLTGTIPSTLFCQDTNNPNANNCIYGAPASDMFTSTFNGCNGLSGQIPATLFAGIHGAPAGTMFQSTFEGCSKLSGQIPATLFAGIHGAPAQSMFYYTFSGCSGLTGSIPSTLFCQDTNNPNANNCIYGAPASSMFRGTFYNCSGLSGQIPATLFAGIHGTPAQSMFADTFVNCSGLTGTIPSTLFCQDTNNPNANNCIYGAPARGMFSYTFRGCSGLNGFTDGTTTTSYVPGTFLNAIDTNTSVSSQADYMFSDTGLASPCPANTYNVTREQFNKASKPWCTPCPDGTTSQGGSSQCVAPSYTITYNLNGGTGCSNETYTGSTTLCTPTRDGYTFNGWATTDGGTTEYNANDSVSGTNLTLYANWEIAYPFAITTTEMTANDTFKWIISASGTFTVDCGDNGVLSGTGVSGNTITRSNTTAAQYTCTYPTAGIHTIRFGGAATGYDATDSSSSQHAAINFSISSYSNNTPTKIAGISGSLGAIFGTIGNGGTLATQPRFIYTFYYAYNMTGSIPSDLFTGITGAPVKYMFHGTFYYCSKLSGQIPATLFAGIHGAPAEAMFHSTFSNCSGLTGTIPSTLFCQDTNNPNANNCIYGAPARGMFTGTFMHCSGLSGQIPATLFAGIHGFPASSMFNSTFDGCSGLTGTIPSTLFCQDTNNPNVNNCIYGAPAQYMFNSTFQKCSGLSGQIPATLFAGIHGAPAEFMFSQTFSGCSGLSGQIPATLFAGIHGAPAERMFTQTFNGCIGLTGSIPSTLFCQDTNNPNADNCIYGAPKQYMFSGTFSGCSKLSGQIPATLFAGIHGAPAESMFTQTFEGCSGLNGFTDGTTTTSYVPGTFLNAINTNTSVSNKATNMFNGTDLASPCPANTYDVTREQFNDASKPWCTPCPDGTTSPAGSTSIDQCVVPSYTITFNLNSGAFPTGVVAPSEYTDSGLPITLPTPTRDGYNFDGWYDNEELTGNAVTTIESGSTGNREYWAKWTEKPTYTITYNLNNGTGCSNTTYMDSTTLCEPTRDGYTFGGWATTDGGATEYNANESVSGTSLTLYANWNATPETLCLEQGQYFSWDSENNTCVYDEESECTDNGDVWDVDTCITHDEYCEANYGDNYVWNGESCEQAAFECTSGKWLHLGNKAKLCLSETKPASHESPVVLKVQVGNDVYYLSATPGVEYLPVNEDSTGVKMKMYYKGRTYNVHDKSISVF